MKRGIALFTLALSGLGACYSYQPIATSATPKVGERIHVELNPQGTVELARYLGPRVTRAEGALASVADDGALTVAVDFVQFTDGNKQPWNGEGTVVFPRMYVDSIRERRFEKRRTIFASAAAGGGVIAMVLIAMAQAGAFGGDGGGGLPPPP